MNSGAALTEDQRWLLLHIGGWSVVWMLAEPAGVTHFMQSMSGACGVGPRPGEPKWLGGWETRRSIIRSTNRGGPRVEITASQINRYAKTLAGDIKAELIECRRAGLVNAHERYSFCHCRTQPCGYQYMGDYIHRPAPARVAAAADDHQRIVAWQPRVLRKALHLDGGQLELFEAA